VRRGEQLLLEIIAAVVDGGENSKDLIKEDFPRYPILEISWQFK
jgi:hypothetical protein